MSKNENNTIGQKINQLNTEIEWFYGDDFSLDEATERYKKSLKLAKEVEQDLQNLKNEIKVLSEDFTK